MPKKPNIEWGGVAMKPNSFVVAVVAVAGMVSNAAQGIPLWTITTQGRISEGFDHTGVFGVPKRDLAGLEYTQTLIANVDRSKYNGYQNATENNLYGREGIPAFAVIDAVAGRTVRYDITRDMGQQHYLSMAALLGGEDQVYTNGFGWDDTRDNYVGAFAYVYTSVAADSFVPTLDFAQSFMAFIGPETPSSDYFYATGTRGAVSFRGDVQVIRVVASNAADLPEPASAALFGAGLLGLVALGRRA
jgi:hypothetical protein